MKEGDAVYRKPASEDRESEAKIVPLMLANFQFRDGHIVYINHIHKDKPWY